MFQIILFKHNLMCIGFFLIITNTLSISSVKNLESTEKEKE